MYQTSFPRLKADIEEKTISFDADSSYTFDGRLQCF